MPESETRGKNDSIRKQTEEHSKKVTHPGHYHWDYTIEGITATLEVLSVGSELWVLNHFFE